MKFLSILALSSLSCVGTVLAKSQDYARHLELSLLFYEAQRSGKLPESNRIPWRGDSGLNHGEDVGVDLTGGYYDAGDNVKFNFPQAFTMTTLAWTGIDFAKGVEMAGQTEFLKDAVKWGCDYLLKCHELGTDTYYMQVGDGDIDHSYWKAVEDIDYPTPAFWINSTAPGSEVSGETAAAFASASILFKDSDKKYSQVLLENALEWYNFAETYKGDYSVSVPKVDSYYNDWSGYDDELGWAAIWLYRATGEQKYLDRAKEIVQKWRYTDKGFEWDMKYPGIIAQLARLGEPDYVWRLERWIYEMCDDDSHYTPGGLFWNSNSEWGSNRRAAEVAASFVFYTSSLPEGNAIREKAKKFAQEQIDYIQGNNPLGIDYIVGADETSPKRVHHRTASGAPCTDCAPLDNAHILYGALAGGPDEDDSYVDDRSDYRKNEVALDYNVCYTAVVSYLVQENLNVEDPITWEYDYRNVKKQQGGIPTEPKKCWAEKLGYECCPSTACNVYFTDSDGKWSVNKGDWCGIDDSVCKSDSATCWSQPLGYPCCSKCVKIEYLDNDGKWGVENGDWCGLAKNC